MATTVTTLNGGPSGGLSTTSSSTTTTTGATTNTGQLCSIITSPPGTCKTTTTRVVIEGEQGEETVRLETIASNDNDSESVESGVEDPGALPSLESWATSSATTAAFFLDSAAIKKRRKQSRPVRIPLLGNADVEGSMLLGQNTTQYPPCSSLTLSVKGGGCGSPLNLSKTEQHNSVLLLDPTHNNNNNNNNHHHHHQVTSPSFSPILFPLSSSSPFSGLFPGFPGCLPPGHTNLNPPSGTPTSSSSNGSIHNNNNNNNNNNHGHSINHSSSMSSNRIFNPEAYCDLCNKEFCNKYFLKTHKANKHGVYTDQPNVQSSLPFLSALGPCQQQQQLPQPFSSTTSGQGHVDSPFYSGMPVDLKSGDSFCQLCSKDFCNKYFLKRHKAKIHGIPMDPSGGSIVSNGSHSEMDQVMMSKSGMEESGDEEGEVLLGHRSESSAHSNYEEHDNESESEAVINLRRNRSPSLQKTPPRTDEPTDFKMSSAQQAESGSHVMMVRDDEEQQRQRGLSPEDVGNLVERVCACQLCFREFSSKSSLRSHLAKKHGLMIPSTFPPSFLLPFAGMASPLLFDESVLASAGANVTTDHRNNDSHSPSDLDCFECSLCNRTFQTVYLLRMHKSYFHPDSTEDSHEETLKYKYSHQQVEDRQDSKESVEQDTEAEASEDAAEARDNKTMVDPTPVVKTEGGDEDRDDLRRLQSMIMELNRVSAAGAAWSPPPPTPESDGPSPTLAGVAVCPLCSKEFYSTYFLTQHMAQSHPNVMSSVNAQANQDSQPISNKSESPGGGDQQQQQGVGYRSAPARPLGNSKQPAALLPWPELPELPGDLSNRERDSFLTPGKSSNSGGSGGKISSVGVENCLQQQGKRPSPSLSRSYCTICHKELCNKYFMRTHMLKMHGISIESSTGLGGVTCDICNKELCSKYFLKVHKQNTHGIVEEGPSPPVASTTPLGLDTPLSASSVVPADSPLSALDSLFLTDGGVISPLPGPVKSDVGSDLHTRYFSHYSEVCPICTRRFRSLKWLKTHLITDHGQEGRDKWKSLHSLRRAMQNQQQSSSSMAIKGKSNGGQKSGGGKRSPSKSRNNGAEAGNNVNKTSTGNSTGNKCVLCGVNTPGIESLKMHILKEHGDELKSTETGGTEELDHDQRETNVILDPLNLLFQKMDGGAGGCGKLYRCSYCPFTTTLLVYLYAHERTHTGLANASLTTGMGTSVPPPISSHHEQPLTAPLRCPMCFHTFQQLEAFQQHLIGHQMSGVLAPFFAPTAPFSSQEHRHLLQPPRLNGIDGRENSPTSWSQYNTNYRTDKDQQQQQISMTKNFGRQIGREECLQINQEDNRGVEENNQSGGQNLVVKRKRRRVINFQCSQCPHIKFQTREECTEHIDQIHGPQRRYNKEHQHHASQLIQRNFKCRLCKFQALTYQSLLVHSKIHHSTRSSLLSVELEGGFTQPRVMLQEGMSGDFILQRFFLRSTTDDDDDDEDDDADDNDKGIPYETNNSNDPISSQGQLTDQPQQKKSRKKKMRNQVEEKTPSSQMAPHHECNKSGYFVPSVVYLPVREKVSQSLRVSFSLTPTS